MVVRFHHSAEQQVDPAPLSPLLPESHTVVNFDIFNRFYLCFNQFW
jgi:hypothetical protein